MPMGSRGAYARSVPTHDETRTMKESTNSTVLSQAPAALDLADLQRKASHAAALLKALANRNRLVILCQLADGEKAVGELEAAVRLSQSALSQHLTVLRMKGIVTTRRVAQSILYSLASNEAQAIMRTLHDLFCGKGARARAPQRRPKAP